LNVDLRIRFTNKHTMIALGLRNRHVIAQ